MCVERKETSRDSLRSWHLGSQQEMEGKGEMINKAEDIKG